MCNCPMCDDFDEMEPCEGRTLTRSLLMVVVDRLGRVTDTTVVSQRSEVGQGILGSKTGRGKYDMWWYDWVVKTLLSSCMSVGRFGLSLTEHHDMKCLTITHHSFVPFHYSLVLCTT